MHNRAMNTSEVTDTAMTLEISTVLIVAMIPMKFNVMDVNSHTYMILTNIVAINGTHPLSCH